MGRTQAVGSAPGSGAVRPAAGADPELEAPCDAEGGADAFRHIKRPSNLPGSPSKNVGV